MMCGTLQNRTEIMMNNDRTLYLNEKRGLVVRRDGPSLWIKEKGRAGRRVPAKLINMVYVIGNIRMEAGVITLFTENGIPVTFLNVKGEVTGLALPGSFQNGAGIMARQRAVFESGRRRDQYRTWLLSVRRRYQLKTLQHAAGSTAILYMDKGFRERDYRSCIEKARRGNEQRWRAACTIVGNLMTEMVVGRIMEAGLDPHAGARSGEHYFTFAHDLCRALLPLADLFLLRFVETSRDHHFAVDRANKCLLSREGIRNLVYRFEESKKMLLQETDNTVLSFFEFMRENPT